MKNKFTLILFLISIFGLILRLNAQELRGTWITNVDSYVLFNDRAIEEAMDYLASIGINTVFVCVWNKGFTLYPSDVMNRHFGISIWPNFSGRDPFEKVLIEAHKNGIEVIAWFEYGLSPWYAQNQNDSGHIIKKYPHWAALNRTGKLATRNSEFPQFIWMSGINPEVQNFMISLFTEVIDKYDIDGVQADDRLPAMAIEGGYDSVTVSIYKQENNGASPPYDFQNSQWKRWRADKLNHFFKRLYDSVKVRSEHLILSSTPSVYPWGYENYLQDSKTWVDSSYCDTFMPQLYRYNFSDYLYELNLALSYVPLDKRNIFFPAVLMKIGNWLISQDYLNNVLQANRQRYVKGESFFFYEGLRANNNSLGDFLRSTYYSIPTLLPYRNGNIWRPKGILVDDISQNAVKTGSWSTFPAGGYQSGFKMTNDTAYASIEYFAEIPYDAYYHVYAFVVTNTVNTNQARYVVYHQNDSTVLHINQSNPSNYKWIKLGDFYFTKGNHKILKIDNVNLPHGRYITADAVLLLINRKLSPDLIVTKVEHEQNNSQLLVDKMNKISVYPNPFNSTTKIQFFVEFPSEVEIKLFDILGREIHTIKKFEFSSGIKTYEIDFNKLEIASGIYSGVIKIGSQYQTFKMSYIR